MISDNKQKELLSKINNIEQKIQEIHYIEQFEIANQFNIRLSIIKEKFLNGFGFSAYESEMEIEEEIQDLETDVLNFLQERVNNEVTTQEKNTEQLWNGLKNIADKLKESNCSVIEKQEWNRRIAEGILKIINEQAKIGEEIRLDKVQEYCELDDFLFVIKEKLIRIAQRENENEQKTTLNMANKLNLSNINDIKLWQKLTNINEIKISDIGELKEENYAITVVKPKTSLVQIIKERMGIKSKPKTTVYTFGDINPETLEWENVEVIIDEFPKKFSKKQIRRLLAIEINDVREITKEHGLGKYPNLEKVTFGKKVVSIGAEVFWHWENREYLTEIFDFTSKKEHIRRKKRDRSDWFTSFVKEIKISNSVLKIERGAFSELPELLKIEFGNGISKIPDSCCYNCNRLKEIKFPDNLTKIGNSAFSQKRRYYRIGSSKHRDYEEEFAIFREKILEKYEKNNKYEEIVVLPETVQEIDFAAFGLIDNNENKYSVFSLSLTNNQLEKIEDKRFVFFDRNIRILDHENQIKQQESKDIHKKISINKELNDNSDDLEK